MKALQYKEYFTHIDSEQILKSLEDIHVIGLINDERETNLCRKHRVYIFHVQAIQTKVST
jgi:hypothetical protein